MLDMKNMPKSDEDLNRFLDAIPFTAYLGIRADLRGNEITCRLPFQSHLVGNPLVPALHGGVLGSLLETVAILQLAFEVRSAYMPKPVDLTFDYFRSGKTNDVYARAQIMKKGRRAANVHAIAWQEDKDRPIAAVHGNFLVRPDEEST